MNISGVSLNKLDELIQVASALTLPGETAGVQGFAPMFKSIIGKMQKEIAEIRIQQAQTMEQLNASAQEMHAQAKLVQAQSQIMQTYQIQLSAMQAQFGEFGEKLSRVARLAALTFADPSTLQEPIVPDTPAAEQADQQADALVSTEQVEENPAPEVAEKSLEELTSEEPSTNKRKQTDKRKQTEAVSEGVEKLFHKKTPKVPKEATSKKARKVTAKKVTAKDVQLVELSENEDKLIKLFPTNEGVSSSFFKAKFNELNKQNLLIVLNNLKDKNLVLKGPGNTIQIKWYLTKAGKAAQKS